MVNIFNFPPKKGKAQDQDFLHENSDLVQFDTAGRDVDLKSTGRTGIPFSSPQDWTNQELASIYRVKRLLDAAGVHCHLERSLSDEGDPWCIFCTPTGEVFIHLSRIDGFYVLDSPNLTRAIFGQNFSELIEQFSTGALKDSDKAAKVRRRLIRLERGGKVFLHPAALLAALIWSVYLNSEDLVFFVPDEDEDDVEGAITQVTAAIEATDAEDAEMEAHFVSAVAHPDHVISAHLPETGGADGKLVSHHYKEIVAKTGMALLPSAMAVGLSSIAIAYGFLSEGYFDEDPAGQAELGLGQDGELQVEHAGLDLNDQGPPAPPAFDLTAVLDSMFQAPDDAVLPDELVTEPDGLARVDISKLLEVAMALPKAQSTAKFVHPEQGAPTPAEAESPDLILPEVLTTPESDTDPVIITAEAPRPEAAEDPSRVDVLPISTTLDTLAELRDSFSDRLTEFFVGDTRFEASFDIASLSVGTTRMIDASLSLPSDDPVAEPVDVMDPTPITSSTVDLITSFFQRPEGGSLINENAISFVSYLMTRENEVQVISRGDEIVLIDFSAFGAGDVISMSWDLEHGGTVQTIGLRTDFAEFDLLIA